MWDRPAGRSAFFPNALREGEEPSGQEGDTEVRRLSHFRSNREGLGHESAPLASFLSEGAPFPRWRLFFYAHIYSLLFSSVPTSGAGSAPPALSLVQRGGPRPLPRGWGIRGLGSVRRAQSGFRPPFRCQLAAGVARPVLEKATRASSGTASSCRWVRGAARVGRGLECRQIVSEVLAPSGALRCLLVNVSRELGSRMEWGERAVLEQGAMC